MINSKSKLRHHGFIMGIVMVLLVSIIMYWALSAPQIKAWGWDSTWATTSVPFDDHTLPLDWRSDMSFGSQQWNNVSPSPFVFYRDYSINNDVFKASLPSNTLGQTEKTISGGTLTRILVKFNYNKSWHTGSGTSFTEFDLQSVATHEFGHGTGLLHTVNGCGSGTSKWLRPTMCDGYGAGEYWKRTLEQDDRDGLNYHYP